LATEALGCFQFMDYQPFSIVEMPEQTLKAAVLQIILENHELCKYAKISLHIHKIVYLNQNIA